MDRETFILKNPEEALRQEKEGNKSIARIVIIVTLGVSAIVGTHKYSNDEGFRTRFNDVMEKLYYESLRCIA